MWGTQLLEAMYRIPSFLLLMLKHLRDAKYNYRFFAEDPANLFNVIPNIFLTFYPVFYLYIQDSHGKESL